MVNISLEQALETTEMFAKEHLDVRTITMGISLLDTMTSDVDKLCKKISDKIFSYANELVKVGNDISDEYGIPIINDTCHGDTVHPRRGMSGHDIFITCKERSFLSIQLIFFNTQTPFPVADARDHHSDKDTCHNTGDADQDYHTGAKSCAGIHI